MVEVIHEWEDGTKFGLDQDGYYKLLYKGVLESLTVVRLGFTNMVMCSNNAVPKQLLEEIGHNL